MTIRRKTRKRGGGEREKLVAWIDYVLNYGHVHGWEKFPMIEMQTTKNGKIVKTIVEMEASERVFGAMGPGAPRFPSTKQNMNKKYATGLAMHLWNPKKGTGTNHDLYRRFESQYHNDSNINSMYGNESRSHSPVRDRNIIGVRQHLTEVEEKIDSISSRAASSASIRQPLPNIGSVLTKKNKHESNQARIEELAAKLHSNAEEARELKELQKKLNEAAIAKWIQYSMSSPRNLNNKLIKQITKNEEVILYVTYLRCGSITSHVRGDNDLYTPSFNISLIITNRNVYFVRIHRESYKTEDNVGLTSGLHYMSVYTFDKPLNLKQTKMLSILTSNTDYREEDYAEPILRPGGVVSILAGLNRVMGGGRGEMAYIMFPYLEAKKKFESVIRAIPGSYKNENWRPLDGFFGLYLNETTMEINEFPGEILE